MKKLINYFSFVVLSFLLISGGFAFSQQIKGNIQDEDSNPIPGVTAFAPQSMQEDSVLTLVLNIQDH